MNEQDGKGINVYHAVLLLHSPLTRRHSDLQSSLELLMLELVCLTVSLFVSALGGFLVWTLSHRPTLN